jgi:TetR/AcrR family transcriptional regulator, cholesterol catabolism regulator
MEEKIQQKAEELFFTYGLKTVSMDDIAREAGVSKKTIYQSFDDKNTLVKTMITKLIEQQQQQLKTGLNTSENAIHEVIQIAENLQSLIIKIKPVMLYDLSKYFPECWKLMNSFKEENLRSSLHTNFKTGIAEGLYRKDLDLDSICQFSLIQFSSFFKPESYPANRFRSSAVIWEITELFLYGISSPKGQIVTKKYFDNIKKQ